MNPMENHQSPDIAAALIRQAEGGADAVQIAAAITSTWRDVDAALSPILGHRGVASLYKRSLHITSAAHPWLAGTHDGLPTVMDLAPLQAALSHQSSVDAATSGGALLHTFHELLASLVGRSLTEQLLHSVWADAASRAPAQEISP